MSELKRLKRLSLLGLQVDEMNEQLRPFIELAKRITRSPTAAVNIIDAYHQWTVAGTDDLGIIDREASICQHTIMQPDVHEISSLSDDERYKDMHYVKETPYFKYYCGVPLTTSDNHTIGSICVLDHESKMLTESQKAQLQLLSDLIMERIESERDRRAVNEYVGKMQKDLRKLHHDVRGPISGIVGLTEIIEEDSEPDPETGEMLDMIKNCAQTVVEKIDGILEKISGDEAVSRPAYSLQQLADRIKKLYQPQALHKNIGLSIQVDDERGREINGPQALAIIQVTGNLISNGLKFTPSGGRVDVALTCALERSQRVLKGRVSDSGKGMTDAQVAAFNSGGEVEKSAGARGEKSFGIGLQHVLNLIGEGGGAVSVQSAEGEGASFSFRLPLEK